MTQAKTKAACSSVPLDPLVGPDALFEVWYESRGLSQFAHWHPERGGYTLASTKQLCWETWQAAKLKPEKNWPDVLDAACETMEMIGMHDESSYKELKRLHDEMVQLMTPNDQLQPGSGSGRSPL